MVKVSTLSLTIDLFSPPSQDLSYCCDYECCMKKKWVFWLVFSIVVTVLVMTVFVLLLKGIRRSRRVEELVNLPNELNDIKPVEKLFSNKSRFDETYSASTPC